MMLRNPLIVHFLIFFLGIFPTLGFANSENDKVVNAMIAEAKNQAAASPGKCVDMFPDEVNQQGADYKLIYLPNRKFKSFKSMDACVDHMMALYKSGGSYPRDMIENADKKKRQSSQVSKATLARTQFDPDKTKSFYCPGRKKVFGRQSARNCLNSLTAACDDAYSRKSDNAQIHAHRVDCYLKSIVDQFPNERDLGLVADTMGKADLFM